MDYGRDSILNKELLKRLNLETKREFWFLIFCLQVGVLNQYNEIINVKNQVSVTSSQIHICYGSILHTSMYIFDKYPLYFFPKNIQNHFPCSSLPTYRRFNLWSWYKLTNYLCIYICVFKTLLEIWLRRYNFRLTLFIFTFFRIFMSISHAKLYEGIVHIVML